jgi:hypothetical protein
MPIISIKSFTLNLNLTDMANLSEQLKTLTSKLEVTQDNTVAIKEAIAELPTKVISEAEQVARLLEARDAEIIKLKKLAVTPEDLAIIESALSTSQVISNGLNGIADAVSAVSNQIEGIVDASDDEPVVVPDEPVVVPDEPVVVPDEPTAPFDPFN